MVSINLKKIFEDSSQNNSIDKRQKIDFPGQSPLSSAKQSQKVEVKTLPKRLRSASSKMVSEKASKKSASEPKIGSAKISQAEKSVSSKNKKFRERKSSNKLEGNKPSSLSNQKHPKDTLKKRDLKDITKQKIETEITQNNILDGRRRSSRLEQIDDKDPNRSKYTVDKLRHNEFRDQVFEQDRIEQEELLIQKVKEASLCLETKHKHKKDLQKQSDKFFKNFMNENSEYFEEELTKDAHPSSKKSVINTKTPEKQSKNPNSSESDFQPSSGDKSQLSSDKPNVQKKEEAKNELSDLLELGDDKAKTAQKPSQKQKDDDDFLEPFPVHKKNKTQNQTPKKNYISDVPNPMDTEIRDQFTSYLNFVDFKKQDTENALYKPAMIQKVQNASPVQIESSASVNSIANTAASSEAHSQITLCGPSAKDISKGHFIKRKQTHCNVKRICGVSYVKKTESKQANVRDRGYQKLPPIVIQGSYTLPKQTDSEADLMYDQIQRLLSTLLFEESSSSSLVITAFESVNEIDMKQYLLKPHKRAKISKGQFWVVYGQKGLKSILDQLWMFIKDKFFLCIHLMYDSDSLVKGFEFNPEAKDQTIQDQVQDFVLKSDICIGLLPKRGNASVKSMLKAYKMEEKYDAHMRSESDNPTGDSSICSLINCKEAFISGINTIAYLSRLELYVSEDHWTESSMKLKHSLTLFIHLLEDNINQILLQWNQRRTMVFQNLQTTNNVVKVSVTKDVNAKRQFRQWKDLNSMFAHAPDQSNLEALLRLNLESDRDPIDVIPHLKKNLPVPVTLINTRDCFAYDLKCTNEILNLGKGRENVVKKEYYFDPTTPNSYPANFQQVMGYSSQTDMTQIQNLKVGVTCYENFYSPEEMDALEKNVMDTEKISLSDGFLPMTAQKTFTGTNLKRTKFFFGYRYMWTRTQLQDPLANVAAGVRADVSQPPIWMKEQLEDPLVDAGVIEENFVNSVALNVYHDGSEGLAQHFDDATRFKQPIYTLRLFSDSRLSFGSQYYGFQNGAYYIPLPRGCICVMEESSYSANGVKHCVRPCDMTGKSSAVILRQMHPNVIDEAVKLDRNIDLPMWMSSLSLEDKSIAYYKQRELECDWLENNIQANCLNKSASVNKQLKVPKKVSLLSKRPFKSITQNIDDPDKNEIVQILDKIVSRIETKAQQEEQITRKISVMRQKLRSSNPGADKDELQVVGLFKTELMKK